MSHEGSRRERARPGLSFAAWWLLAAASLPAQEPRPTFEVDVVDEQGAAVPGAVVRRFEVDGRLLELGVTDANGHFATTRPARPDGMWRLHIAADKRSSVASGAFFEYWSRLQKLPLVMGRGFALHGRVRDQAGKPVAGAQLCATDILPKNWSAWSSHVEATSNERGIFSLRGMSSPCSRLVLHADGYRSVALAPVLPGTPLEFTLEPAPRLAGKVMDAEGRPVSADLEIYYEGYEQPERIRSEADGSFDVTWRHATLCRIVARRGYPAEAFCATKVLRKPAADLELRLQPISSQPLLRVRATGDDGAALAEFRAVVFWGFDEMVPDTYLLQQMALQGRSARDGVAHLPRPNTNSSVGRLLVLAPGRALTSLKVEWSPGDDGATEVSVPTGVEARLEGVVRNVSGAPAAGVMVWAQRVQKTNWQMPASAPPQAVVTGPDGSFVLEGLAPGPCDVFAARDYLPPRGPRRLDLVAGGAALHVDLKVPDLATVAGKADGVTPGWRLAFVTPKTLSPDLFGVDLPIQAHGAFEAGGAFSVPSVQVGLQTATLLIPRPAVRGDWLRVPVRTTRVGKDGEQDFEVDADSTGPTRLRGRVVRRGSLIPFERLLVQQRVLRAENPLRQFQVIDWMDWTASSRVAGDGSFELLVAPGRHQLRVVDMMTGIVLRGTPEPLVADEEEVAVPDIELDVAEIQLEFRAVDADADGPAGFLMHRIGNEGGAFGFSVDAYSMTGIDLRDRLTTRVVYVSAGEGTFSVHRSTLPERVSPLRPLSTPEYRSYSEGTGGIPYEVTSGATKTLRIDVPRRKLD